MAEIDWEQIRRDRARFVQEIDQKKAWAADAIFTLSEAKGEDWSFGEWFETIREQLTAMDRPELAFIAELAFLGFLVAIESIDESWVPREDWLA